MADRSPATLDPEQKVASKTHQGYSWGAGVFRASLLSLWAEGEESPSAAWPRPMAGWMVANGDRSSGRSIGLNPKDFKRRSGKVPQKSNRSPEFRGASTGDAEGSKGETGR